ncbi:MAG TPA: hypothetical protein VL523_08130 [Terriglobia bacterium]|nr:hypothetical protein [Terriglobia bacterium]
MQSSRRRQFASCRLSSGLFVALMAIPGARLFGQSATPASRAARNAVQAAAGNPAAASTAKPAGKTALPDAGAKAQGAASSREAAGTGAGVAKTSSEGLRDPFRSPDGLERSGPGAKVSAPKPRPPGIRGLLVSQLRLQGIVQEEASRTMIAVVTNATNLSYFLRENERLYDGVVNKITPTAVYFRQDGPDPSGGAKSREVVLRVEQANGNSQ